MKFKHCGEIVDSEKDEIMPVEYEDFKIGNSIHKRVIINDDNIIETAVSIFEAIIEEIKANREMDSEEVRILEDLIQYYDYNFTDYGDYESEPYAMSKLKNMLEGFHSHRPEYLQPWEVHVNWRLGFTDDKYVSYWRFDKKILPNGYMTFCCPDCNEGDLNLHHWLGDGIVARCNKCDYSIIMTKWHIDPDTDCIRLPFETYSWSVGQSPEYYKEQYLKTPLFAVFPENER